MLFGINAMSEDFGDWRYIDLYDHIELFSKVFLDDATFKMNRLIYITDMETSGESFEVMGFSTKYGNEPSLVVDVDDLREFIKEIL